MAMQMWIDSCSAFSLRDLRDALPRSRAVQEVDALIESHTKIQKRVEFLAEQLRRIHRVGHNEDCLFCGFKDRQVMESNVIEGTAEQSAEPSR